MASAPVAKRYARALFELGVEYGELDAFGEALQWTGALFKASDELRTVLFNPAIRLEERRAVLEVIAEKAEWPALYCNFMYLLLDKDRLGYLGDMAQAFAEKVDEYQGRARARVTSAVDLGDEEVERIRARLAEITGKEVELTTDVDEELIGGVIARVGSTIYDGSVRTHLMRMREAILKEV